MGLKSHIDYELTEDLKRRLRTARDDLSQARFKLECDERLVSKAIGDINDIKALALKYQIELG